MSAASHGGLREIPGDATPLEMFDRTVWELGGRPLLHAFEVPLAARRVAELVDGVTAGMRSLGVARGDRVALYLQNDPQFVIAMLATWRLGAIAVPCNPMLRARELGHHLRDADVRLLVALDELHDAVAREAVEGTGVVVVTTGARDLREERPATGGADDRPAKGGADDRPAIGRADGTHDLLELARAHANERVEPPDVGPDDVAVLTYTSGTTGPPKGAMSTHGNVAYAARIYRDLLGVGADDTILGIAPLYHVTGLTGHIGLAIASGASLVLAHRFDAVEAARLTAHHAATVTIAAITAYIAIADDERARAHDMRSLTRAYSGGAPIAPSVVRDIAARTGIVIRPVYGLTETTGPTHLAPPDVEPPTDPASGVLSVGLAAPGTTTRILADDGRELPPGEAGEVAIGGPQVVPGYWRRPDETRAAFPGGELRTGDVGMLDADGWLYLVDRRKDMIIASGFKVWPREVEDVLYEHEAVREAAVVGVPDAYRGETVWAYVSLKAGCRAAPEELVAHCRARLAAYKYPRTVHVLEELPKTPSGKILRRDLRAAATTASEVSA